LNVAIHCFGTMLKVEGLEKRLGLGLARSRSRSCLVAEIRRLGLISVSSNCRKVLVSVSSRTKNRMSQSRKLRSRLHPWIFGRPFVKRFALCFWTIVCPVCLSVLSVTLVYCGQTVGWMKMKLGMQVGIGPGQIMLHGDPAPPPQKWSRAPIFGPCLLWPNRWMDQDCTWLGGGPRFRPHCGKWGLSSPPQKRSTATPNFRPMSIVAIRLPILATDDLL